MGSDGNSYGRDPFRQYTYIPLGDRLRFQYKAELRSRAMQTYCGQFFDKPIEYTHQTIKDWWCGSIFRELRQNGLFTQCTDIALQIALDGVGITKRTNHTSTPVILINYNLPPAMRYQKYNILLAMSIPGPKKYKSLDSFLYPLVEELEMLGAGINAYDGYRKQHFLLRAHPVVVTGDGPAISEAIGMKIPGNAKKPCRFCHLEATQDTGGHYRAFTPTRWLSGDPHAIPLRSDLRRDIEQSVMAGQVVMDSAGKSDQR
jgi:hypothetical protein